MSTEAKAGAASIGTDRAGGTVVTCEHASKGLPDAAAWPIGDEWLRETHWAYDLGARELATELALKCGGPCVLAQFSRLLVDPNRPLESETLFRATAEGRAVMLNESLSSGDRNTRVGYWNAYHDAVSRACVGGKREVVFAVHTFTPTYDGQARDFEVGVLFDREEKLAETVAGAIAGVASVRMNEPYSGKEGLIYSAERHAVEHGLRAVEIEVRQDCAVNPDFRARLIQELVKVLPA